MPRYYFAVHNRSSVEDEGGIELPSLDAAKKEAVRYAGALLADDKGEIWTRQDWHLEVTDERGLILLRIDIAANVSAAAA